MQSLTSVALGKRLPRRIRPICLLRTESCDAMRLLAQSRYTRAPTLACAEQHEQFENRVKVILRSGRSIGTKHRSRHLSYSVRNNLDRRFLLATPSFYQIHKKCLVRGRASK